MAFAFNAITGKLDLVGSSGNQFQPNPEYLADSVSDALYNIPSLGTQRFTKITSSLFRYIVGVNGYLIEKRGSAWLIIFVDNSGEEPVETILVTSLSNATYPWQATWPSGTVVEKAPALRLTGQPATENGTEGTSVWASRADHTHPLPPNLPDQPVNSGSSPFFTDIYAGSNVYFNTEGIETGGTLGKTLQLPSVNSGSLSSGLRRNAILREEQALYFGDATGDGFSRIMVAGNASATGLSEGTLSDLRLSANVPLKYTANTFTQNQVLSGSANTAPNQTSASGSSIMTRDLVDQRMIFGGPYVSNIATVNWNQVLGTGGTTTNNGNFFAVGNGATPTAGVTAAYLNTPNTGYQFVSPDNGLGSTSGGNGGVINFTQPFALGFFIEVRGSSTNALDNISRVYLGGSTVTLGVAGGINNAGFGVRISRATSTTHDVAIYARTIATTNTNITAATNATPIVITNNGHNLQNGDLVEITGVVGNTAANGIRTVANRTANTFELSGSVGNGAYISGGVANKISVPIQITAGRVRRMFLYSRGNGTLELHLGSITNTPAITLTGMSVYSGTQIANQSLALNLSQQSVTDATAFAQTVISNFMLIQP